MSHLACAEETSNPLNEAQRARFERLRGLLPEAPASLANSSGIYLGPAFHYALCRPGVALYGVNPTPGRANPMAPVVTLEAPVLQVHEVAEPGSVGYGATYRTAPGMRIATVPVGYADGYLRSASGRATARIAGQEVPLAGRVSMDLISLDVSALPAEAGASRHHGRADRRAGRRRPSGRGRGHHRLRSADPTWQPVRAPVYPAGSREDPKMNPLAVIGRIFLSFLSAIGDLTLFAGARHRAWRERAVLPARHLGARWSTSATTRCRWSG